MAKPKITYRSYLLRLWRRSEPEAHWQAMLESVQRHGKADLEYTLNSIDLKLEDGIAHSPVDDQYKQDLFYRYNQNFQDFFDASARVETTFA